MSRTLSRVGGEATVLPGFVVIVLLLLILTPYGFEQSIGPHREYIEEVVQPVRESVRGVESRLTEEIALSRGYLVTRDNVLLDDYRRVQVEQEAHLELLRSRAARLREPELRERVRSLEVLVLRGHEPEAELRRGEISLDEYVTSVAEGQDLLRTTAATVQSLASDLIEAEGAERERIRSLRRYQNVTLLALAVLAVLAALATGWLAVRLRRRSQQEAALRRIASGMNAAVSVDQIAEWVVSNALSMLGGDAAIAERADPEREEVEIVAASGRARQLRGTRATYPGVLTRSQFDHGGPRQFDRGELTGAAPDSFLSREFHDCSGATFPFMSDTGAMGALTVLRGPDRHPFSDAEMQRGEVLADLAALATRKILLLERSQVGWERAEHLLEGRSRMIRGLSHDLRNPLGAILGYVQLLDSGIKGTLTEEQRLYLSRMERAIRAINDTIQHLVEVGRSDTVEVPLNRERMSIRDLIEDVVEEHRGEAEHAGLGLEVEIPEDLPMIESDPVHIRTILGNLLSNAVKYTSHGGIDVRARVQPAPHSSSPAEWLTVEVEDTGPGIAREDQDRVFEEFTRLGGSLAPGEGIGLANSRRAAQQLGGELELESTPGEGSRFILRLPVEGTASAADGAAGR